MEATPRNVFNRNPTRRARDRDEILDAAARVFRRRGYRASTVEDIATELGILKGSLYHYINSKQELLYEVVVGPLRLANTKLCAVLDGGGSVEFRLREACRAHMEVIRDDFPRLTIALTERLELPEEQISELRELMRRYEQQWEDMVQEGIRAGIVRPGLNVRLTTLAFLGMLNWASQWYRREGAESAEEIGAIFADIGLRGILA